MDKSEFLVCTDNHGQPIVNKKGKLIYFCPKTGALTSNDELSHKFMNKNTSQIVEEDVTQSIEPIVDEKTDTTNEDRFTHEMTIKLLEIVQSKCHLLNDKMHSKKKVWADIGTEMQRNGYLVTYGRKAADKCHQRWRNLEKVYRGHCRYMKSTGTGKKKPPKYFEEMHEIIGEKHSSHPVHLLDSLHDSDTAASEICSTEAKSNEVVDNIEDSLDMGDDESENIIKKKDYNLKKANIFENVKKSVRPKTDVSTVLKELHAQDMQIENERFEKFQALLVEQNELKRKTLEQRDEFLTVIKNVFNLEARKKSRKRKHSSDSD